MGGRRSVREVARKAARMYVPGQDSSCFPDPESWLQAQFPRGPPSCRAAEG